MKTILTTPDSFATGCILISSFLIIVLAIIIAVITKKNNPGKHELILLCCAGVIILLPCAIWASILVNETFDMIKLLTIWYAVAIMVMGSLSLISIGRKHYSSAFTYQMITMTMVVIIIFETIALRF